MDRWKSHKIVEAGKILRFSGNPDTDKVDFELESGEIVGGVDDNILARGVPEPGDYLVRYPDGYISWSPAKAFDEGYSLADPVGSL